MSGATVLTIVRQKALQPSAYASGPRTAHGLSRSVSVPSRSYITTLTVCCHVRMVRVRHMRVCTIFCTNISFGMLERREQQYISSLGCEDGEMEKEYVYFAGMPGQK